MISKLKQRRALEKKKLLDLLKKEFVFGPGKDSFVEVAVFWKRLKGAEGPTVKKENRIALNQKEIYNLLKNELNCTFAKKSGHYTCFNQKNSRCIDKNCQRVVHRNFDPAVWDPCKQIRVKRLTCIFGLTVRADNASKIEKEAARDKLNKQDSNAYSDLESRFRFAFEVTRNDNDYVFADQIVDKLTTTTTTKTINFRRLKLFLTKVKNLRHNRKNNKSVYFGLKLKLQATVFF